MYPKIWIYCNIPQSVKKNINGPRVSRISNVSTKCLSKFAVCNSKKPRLIKEQEASELLSNLEIKTPLSKIPLLGEILLKVDKSILII